MCVHFFCVYVYVREEGVVHPEKQDRSGPLTGAGLKLEMYNYIDQGEITALRKKAGLA